MKKNYSFAGVNLQIDIPDQWMYEADLFLTPFQVDSVTEPYVFCFEKVSALLPPKGKSLGSTGNLLIYDDGTRYIGAVEYSWENAYAQVLCNGRDYRVLLKEKQFLAQLNVHTVLNVIGAEHLITQAGGFLFHSSYIRVNGRAILFTAPSGIGKSTQADLWERFRGAEIINGDRSAVCLQNGKAFACGVPFAGSSQKCKNMSLPLSAIIYLRQAPKTTIRRVRGAEAFQCVWEGCSVNTWDRADVDQVSKTVIQVLSSVPVFELACTPDETAILALEGVLTT